MRKDINNEFGTIGPDDAAKNKAANHPTLGDAPQVATNIETISEVAQFMEGLMKGFTKMFCDKSGMLIDLTDKAGREYDRDFMLHVQSRIDQALERIIESLKEHCKAEFLPEDRETMVKLNTNFANARSWVFKSCFLGALFTSLGLTLCIHSCGEQNLMERKLEEQTEIANFGTFIKNRFPKAYNAWVDETTAGQKSGKSGSNTNGETPKSREENGQEQN